jgi:AbrB family looped-hinge helix DNA binding protein
MPRITQKGQVTIPKEIREILNIKTNDIGEFTISEGAVIFTARKGTILDAHVKKSGKKIDFKKTREAMERDYAYRVKEEIQDDNGN